MKQKEAFLALFDLIGEPQLKACFALAVKNETNNLPFDREEKRRIDGVVGEYGGLKFGAIHYLHLENLLSGKEAEKICRKDDGRQSKIKSQFIEGLNTAINLKKIPAEKLEKKAEVFSYIANAIPPYSAQYFVLGIMRQNPKEIKEFIPLLNEVDRDNIRLINTYQKSNTINASEYSRVVDFLNRIKDEACGGDNDKKSFFNGFVASIQAASKAQEFLNNSTRRAAAKNPLQAADDIVADVENKVMKEALSSPKLRTPNEEIEIRQQPSKLQSRQQQSIAKRGSGGGGKPR